MANPIADWSSALRDTDKGLDMFFEGCASAGPDVCPFYAASPDDIRKNLTKIYESLYAHPMPVRSASSFGIFDYGQLRELIFMGLYTPYTTFPLLGRGLASLAAGDANTLFESYTRLGPKFECDCQEPRHADDPFQEARDAIICNDGDYIPTTAEHLISTVNSFMKYTDFGDVLGAGIASICV